MGWHKGSIRYLLGIIALVLYALIPVQSAKADTVTTLPFFDGFETGALSSYWTVDGTTNYYTDVTGDYGPGPASGAYHLVMACTTSGEYSVNETTLSIDLSNYEDVILSFDAFESNDESHGPPAYPFINRAYFDGVAISADGVYWYEVAPLRGLQNVYTNFVVDLDAAVAAAGISYTPTFQIRFNHYDNFTFTSDGIGIDNVSITGDTRDDLNIDPKSPQDMFGYEGGPITPTNLTFDLENRGAAPLAWSIHTVASWLSLSSTGGVLSGGGTVSVEAALDPAVTNWAPVTNLTTLVFSNETSGFVQNVDVRLEIARRALTAFVWDPIPTNQFAQIPFDVRIEAVDQEGRLFAAFNDTAELSAFIGGGVATVGYYDMDMGIGSPSQLPSVVTAGAIPLQLSTLASNELEAIDVLYAQNEGGTFDAEYVTHMAEIEAAVSNGCVLIIHDRSPSVAAPYLPGGSGITLYSSSGADIEIGDAPEILTNGPAGVLDDSSLDMGSSSYHGYAEIGSLPQGARVLLTTPSASQAVTFSYPYGEGWVIYSAIPLDYYLQNTSATPLALRTIYAPNIVAYGVQLGGGGEQPLPVSPEFTGPFSDGVWTGRVAVLAGATNATLRADDGADHIGEANPITLTPLILSIELPDAASEGDPAFSGQVLANHAPESDLLVTIETDKTNDLTVTASVVLPAGQTNVAFDLQVIDDALLDGTIMATVTASGTNYFSAPRLIAIQDNETATLTVTLPETSYEGAGTIIGLLQVEPVPDTDVLVQLVSGDLSTLQSGSVLIPAGEALIQFSLPVVDDNLIEGIQTAYITARVENWTSGHASMFILDDETRALTLQLPDSVMEGDDTYIGGGVLRVSGIPTSDIQVLLSQSVASQISIPSHITIPAGMTNAVFDVVVIDDADTDGTQHVSVLAEAPSFLPASDAVTVLDNEVHHLLVDGLYGDIPVRASRNITISAVTIDDMPLDGPDAILSLSAAGDRGSVILSPTTLTNMVNGMVGASVTFGSIGNDITLVADGGGLSGTSSVFNVLGSQLTLIPPALTNTLAVAGESTTRMLVVSNAGNADLVYEVPLPATTVAADPSLVAFYPFNGNASDASGNGHDGVVTGASLTVDRLGQTNAAYAFDGVSDFIDCGNLIDSFSNFTVSAWIKIDRFTHPVHMGPWSQQSLSGTAIGNYRMATGSDTVSGAFGTVMAWSDDWSVDSRTVHVVPTNEWRLITQTYDGNEIRQYDNGVLINVVSSPDHVLQNDFDFRIGRTASFPGGISVEDHYFDGQIDDLRVYSRALSAEEIRAGYNAGKPDLGVDLTDGLAAYYPFSGSAADATGNGADGTEEGVEPVEDRFGQSIEAYRFDEGNFISTTTGSGAVDIVDKISISVWLNPARFTTKPGGSGGARIILRKMARFNSYGYLLNINPSGILGVKFGNSSVAGTAATASGMDPLQTDRWSHVVVTFDGAELRFYVDGLLVDAQLYSEQLRSTTEPLCIGRLTVSDDGSYYYGDMDELRLYSRVLTEADILELFHERDPATVVDLDRDLAVHYTFEGSAADSSGNGIDGIVEGALPANNRFGFAAGSFWFDEGSFVRTTVSTGAVDIVGKISMAAWVNPEQFETKAGGHGQMRTIVRKLSPLSFFGYAFMLTPQGQLSFNCGNTFVPGTRIEAVNMAPLTLNRWSHVAVIYDGEQVLFYVNGILVDAQAYDLPLLSGFEKLCIGRYSSYEEAGHFYGGIDDVRLYSRALSATEVSYLYSGSNPGDAVWLSAGPAAGIVPPGGSIPVASLFSAAGQTVGDFSGSAFTLLCNDSVASNNAVVASMWAVPPAPVMSAEPHVTPGSSNTVAWGAVAGPVEYMAEVAESTNTAPLQQSGWLSTTNHTFAGLSTNHLYYYRAKASVSTAIGLLEGPWSDWVWSTQISATSDTDFDGLADGWELQHFGSLAIAGTKTDADGDGQSDLDEYIAGMDPTNNASYFAVYDVANATNGQFVIYWDSVTGRIYTVHWTTALTNGFTPVAGGIHYPQNSYTDDVHAAEEEGYYRVEVEME